jgi:hypothetical protein
MKTLARAWVPLLIVVVVVTSGLLVMRVRTFFAAPDPLAAGHAVNEDTKPFNPKVVTYEVFGDSGARADVNYLDLDAEPQLAADVVLPWSLTLSTTAPSVFPNISAQGDGDSLTCRITVDDEVKDEKTTDGVHAMTFCLVKSA